MTAMDDRRPKILIVDDEQINVRLLAGAVSDLGAVTFALDGNEAVEQAIAQQPDLILLDIQIPGKDGYQVCAELKARDDTRNIPVIFVSALGEEGEEKGLQSGAIDYIYKPFRPAIVRARIRNHLDLKHYRDALEEFAFEDGLTGLPNRRAFDTHFEAELRRSYRGGKPLTAVLMDIDHFKQFNDTYGHGKGDDCLRRVGAALSVTSHRPGDMVARYGGEEFVAVFPNCDKTGAERLCEDMRVSIEKLSISHETSSTGPVLTVSIGAVSKVPPSPAEAELFLSAADTQLYASKNKGRNRISCIGG